MESELGMNRQLNYGVLCDLREKWVFRVAWHFASAEGRGFGAIHRIDLESPFFKPVFASEWPKTCFKIFILSGLSVSELVELFLKFFKLRDKICSRPFATCSLHSGRSRSRVSLASWSGQNWWDWSTKGNWKGDSYIDVVTLTKAQTVSRLSKHPWIGCIFALKIWK